MYCPNCGAENTLGGECLKCGARPPSRSRRGFRWFFVGVAVALLFAYLAAASFVNSCTRVVHDPGKALGL